MTDYANQMHMPKGFLRFSEMGRIFADDFTPKEEEKVVMLLQDVLFASTILRDMAEALQVIVDDYEPIRTMNEVEAVLKKFKEWK